MANKGILSKNYYIDSVVVIDFGTNIYNMMAEADQAMGEASEIIAEIASLTERVPGQVRCGALLEACASAQAEIKSVDFLSYGQKVDQGLHNLLDHNQYFTEHFIKNMGTHTEKMRGLGEEFKRLSELITYSGEGVKSKGIVFSAVSNAEMTNADGEEGNSSNQGNVYMSLWAVLAAVLKVEIEVIITRIKNVLSNYMVVHGIGSDEEIEDFTNWILVRRPDLLLQLYGSNINNNEEEVERILDEIFNEIANAQNENEDCSAYMDIYNKYRIEQGVIVFIDFFVRNRKNLINVEDPKLMVPFLRLFYSDDLINLYGIEDASQLENSCQDLINNYLDARKYSFRGKIFYTYTWLQVSNIESFTHNDDLRFEEIVDRFVTTYNENKEIYIRIAEETGIPPEVIAVIHYRENSTDYFAGSFSISLSNGSKLIGIDNKSDEERINDFISEAIIVLNYQVTNQNKLERYNPSADSDDIIAMMCFAEAFNGLGYYLDHKISPYSYSGTNVYESGKYVEDENGNSTYQDDVIDQQVGSYRLLRAITE